jgi:hypothetical protein
MPTFQPPLYHTSEVITNGSTSNPYVQLTFTANTDNEDVNGTYQLWTDLANVDESGKPLYSQGEWHEITFIATVPPTQTGESSSSSSTITLRSRPTPSTSSTPLSAVISIPSTPASYSYTLRQVKPSGEIVWLGSDGSNGSIHVKHSETAPKALGQSGVWEGVTEDLKNARWTSIAMTTDTSSRSVPRT